MGQRFGSPVGEKLDLLPGDPVGDLRIGMAGGACEGHGGDVHRGHAPALVGEPDGVGALAATGVEGGAGRQAVGLRHELRVRPAAPDAGGAAVVREGVDCRAWRRRMKAALHERHVRQSKRCSKAFRLARLSPRSWRQACSRRIEEAKPSSSKVLKSPSAASST